jgi:uncharacterized membrane protein YbaN (DUF454 family)
MSTSLPQPTMITKIDHQLANAEKHVAQKVRPRPWWQRILFPLLGVVLVVAGIIFLFTPIPLAVLAVIGFPFLFCFNPRIEKKARKGMVLKIKSLRRWVRSWKKPKHMTARRKSE